MKTTARLTLMGLTLAALSACVAATPAVQEMSNDAARAAARAVVTPIVSAQVPGPTGVALANCIIDNASATELFTLARATGADADTIRLTSDILARPETVTCATASLGA